MKNKIINFLIFIIILGLSIFLVFQEKIGDLDEIWQYSFASNISKGLIPYKDFNTISTPLFSYIAALFLKLLGDQLIVMRIFDSIVFAFILFMAYKIFEILKLKRIKSVFFVLILYLLFYLDLGVEYNYLVLLLTLISLYFELKNVNKYGMFKANKDILLGIIMGLTIITKHTTGIIIAFVYILYKIIFVKNKDDFKAFLKIALLRTIGVLIPCFIFFTYIIIARSI